MADRKIRILCVDDHGTLVDGLRMRLEQTDDLEFVGRLPAADDLIPTVLDLRPDIVLLDIEMPGADPFDAARELQKQCPETRLIFFSAYVKDRYIDAATNAGAWGYLSKSDEPGDIIEAIRQVASGQFSFSPSVQARLRDSADANRATDEGDTSTDDVSARLGTLSSRELQVLRLIAKGHSRNEIAALVHRSPKTIDSHRISIMKKLDIHNRVDLARFAIREGLVEP